MDARPSYKVTFGVVANGVQAGPAGNSDCYTTLLNSGVHKIAFDTGSW